MSETSVESTERPNGSVRGARSRFARLGAATAALTIAFTGLTVPVAQAIQPGEWHPASELKVNGGLADANGAAIDPSTGDVYITDAANDRFYKFDRNGQYLFEKGATGDEKGNFNAPAGAAVDAFGNVYVVDTGNHRIQKFDRNGTYLTRWGGYGKNNGQFANPRGIAVDSFGNVFVSDVDNHRIQKFGSDGTFLTAWGELGSGNSMFKGPTGVAIAPNGNVFVTDYLNNRVQVFDGNGVYLNQWGSLGSDPGQFYMPVGIAADAAGNVYVADAGNERVQVLDNQGQPRAQLPVKAPSAIAGTGSTGELYIAAGPVTAVYRPATVASFTTGPHERGVAGRTYSSALEAGGFPANVVFSVSSGKLPYGLKLAGNTVSGNPTRAGVFTFSLKADNSVVPVTVKEYTIRIGKPTTKVTAVLSTKSPKKRQTKITALVRVSVPNTTGLSRTGKIRVYYGAKAVKTYTLYKSHNGAVKIRLPKFTKKGKTKVTVRFLGNTQMKSATYSTYVRVR